LFIQLDHFTGFNHGFGKLTLLLRFRQVLSARVFWSNNLVRDFAKRHILLENEFGVVQGVFSFYV
jgi:hypothetical protein